MCTYTMESVVDPCNNVHVMDLSESNWLDKYVETENMFIDYLRSLTFASFNVDIPIDSILPEYDCSESGFEVLDNLYELLVSLCDGHLTLNELTDSGNNMQISDQEKIKKQDSRNKRTLKCFSPHNGKELQVNRNRARSHSSVGVDEILRTQNHLIDNNASGTARKSRRVSVGMRPKSSNWSKVKGAFKRDKSNSRLDSRECNYGDISHSGDEGTEKNESQFSSSHENIAQLTSSDEDFEYYPDGYSNKTDLSYRIDDESTKRDSSGSRHTPHEKFITKSKSAIIQSHSKSCNSPNMSSSLHKNPFKWYRTKSVTPSLENDPTENLSAPPSPCKNSRFLYDEDSLSKICDVQGGNSGNDTNSVASNEVLQEVQNKYESLQKRLSREFYEKYHEWKRTRDSTANDEEETSVIDFDDTTKLSSSFPDQSLSPGFKQKFQEWQKLKGLSLSPTRTKIKNENSNLSKKSRNEWHKWRPGSKSESNVLRFIEKDQGESQRESTEGVIFYDGSENLATYSPLSNKKQVTDVFRGKNDHPVEKKELAWLEKELQKVAREKQRLEKEKEKYAERETRLQNMKRAIKSSRKRKQEVLVPTSTGLFRFQGISSKFTRKLYEWEKAKGITPESSTFALLDSYYGRSDIQGNNKHSNFDATALLSRSRSVGSVEVAGISASMLLSGSVNHQQSSLSLNDMEQLEEAHLQVENDSLITSNSQLFEKETDDNEFDLISNESLIMTDYNKNSISHSIPILSSSINSLHDHDSYTNDFRSTSHSKQKNESGQISESHSLGPCIMFRPIQNAITYEVSSQKEQRDSANADAKSIIDQLRKLRAHISVDDEDRINILTNLEHLADQLVDMVHNLNNKKNENSDELAINITELAITLNKKIKLLNSGSVLPQNEFSANCVVNEKLSNSVQRSGDSAEVDRFPFCPEDTYTDFEDNDSPTVHCTFTLPSWRIKYTTPSSTESESSNRNNYVDSKQTKTERRKHFKDDNSSGADENYDGSDETTLYLDLKSITTKGRRESTDISTSNSDSFISSDTKDKYIKNYSASSEPVENTDQEILHCLLTLEGSKHNELKEKYSKERKFNVKSTFEEKTSNHLIEFSDDEKCSNDFDSEDSPIRGEIRSYSPKPASSRRKCSSCGKIKRISKCRRITSNSYCLCGKQDSEKSGRSSINETDNQENTNSRSKTGQQAWMKNNSNNNDSENNFIRLASYSNTDDLNMLKMGKICRSKICDFSTLKNSDKSNTESDVSRSDKNSVSVIVPTTRKIFAPLKQDEHGGASAVVSFTIDESENIQKDETYTSNNTDPNYINRPWFRDLQSKSVIPVKQEEAVEAKSVSENLVNQSQDRKKSLLEMHANVDKLPPASPLSPKRIINKENSSSIKMMIAHYNKLMSENPEKKPLDSNCWASSLQKSPVLERRNRFEHFRNTSEMNNIRKSKSAVLAVKNQKLEARNGDDNDRNIQFSISKSSSAGSIQYRSLSPPNEYKREMKQIETVEVGKTSERSPVIDVKFNGKSENQNPNSTVTYTEDSLFVSPALEKNSSFESVISATKLRTMKLQEAKNKFFNEYTSPVIAQRSAKTDEFRSNYNCNQPLTANVKTKHDERSNSNRESESSFNLSLNKSISTGAIDDRTKSCNLPACEKSPSKSKFGFFSIASRFRKVKMRRHKDPEVSAVSSLCRASLLVNLSKDGKQKADYVNSSKSCPSSPVMQRSISKRNSSSN